MNMSVGGMIDIKTSVPGMSENLGRIYAALQRQQYLAVNWSTAIETLDAEDASLPQDEAVDIEG